MVRQAARAYWSLGYTLVELMVVLAIIGAVSAMTIYGIKASNTAQFVDTAQKGFISDLRAMQNRVDNGEIVSGKATQEIGIYHNKKYYTINGVQKDLPQVTITDNLNKDIVLCVTDRNLISYDLSGNNCGTCTGSVGYVCSSPPNASVPASIVLTFKSGAITKRVTIKGYGMRITEIDSS